MEDPSSLKFVITCEHATNNVPDHYRHLFTEAEDELESHRGWDPGAFIIAHTIQKAIHAPIIYYPFTRLLIEPNRSLHHPRLFSDFSKYISKSEKEDLIRNFCLPYRLRAEQLLPDGFTTYLRHRVGVQYLGIELEVNQKHYFDSGQHWSTVCRVISDSLLHMQIYE